MGRDRLVSPVEAEDLAKTGGWILAPGRDWLEVWGVVLPWAEAQVVDRRWVADLDAVWGRDRLPGRVEAEDLAKAGGWVLAPGRDWLEVWAVDKVEVWNVVRPVISVRVVVAVWVWDRDQV